MATVKLQGVEAVLRTLSAAARPRVAQFHEEAAAYLVKSNRDAVLNESMDIHGRGIKPLAELTKNIVKRRSLSFKTNTGRVSGVGIRGHGHPLSDSGLMLKSLASRANEHMGRVVFSDHDAARIGFYHQSGPYTIRPVKAKALFLGTMIEGGLRPRVIKTMGKTHKLAGSFAVGKAIGKTKVGKIKREKLDPSGVFLLEVTLPQRAWFGFRSYPGRNDHEAIAMIGKRVLLEPVRVNAA